MVGVSGLLLDDSDQILLLRHRFHEAGIWGMPGGWLSPGETISDCWRREVKEELDLNTAVEAMICHRATRRTLEFFLLGRIQRRPTEDRSCRNPRGSVFFCGETAANGALPSATYWGDLS